MRIRAGTSGFSFAEWKGSFYPGDIASKDMLAFYGTRLSTVEINNTFYRLPKRDVLQGWADQVPAGFRFAIKASRRITHFTRLEEESYDPLAYLLKNLEVLGDRLGTVLFQLPPNLKKDVPRLAAFLGQLPAGRFAFEFRHESWLGDDVYDVLKGHDAALCCADVAEEGAPLVPTASWGYLRLRRVAYEDPALREWVDKIRAQPWTEADIYFKHEDEATGPKLAARFLEML